ncbi:MAG: hypothetical protein IJL67_11265 [Oscillospiraceae bacterium]|nr:hypothetical protein [Oscillospiraceae bacterium]
MGEYLKTEPPVTDLNGELLYNLRNQFLHSGSTNIDDSKVKNESNALNKFILVFGDGTEISVASACIQSKLVTYRAMIIDVTYLCETICDFASWYYNNNKERFEFKISAVTQDQYVNPDPQIMDSNVIVNVLNEKLKKSGSDWRIIDEPDNNPVKLITEAIDVISTDDKLKSKLLEGETITMYKSGSTKLSKRESQVRSFFGQNFKEPEYIQYKEHIIQAVLKSESKLQVNNSIMKVFSSEDTSIIYKRLMPLLKKMPGNL